MDGWVGGGGIVRLCVSSVSGMLVSLSDVDEVRLVVVLNVCVHFGSGL